MKTGKSSGETRLRRPAFQVVLFDLDGTISESAPGITRCLASGLREIGIEERDPAVLRTFIGPPLNIRLQEVYGLSGREIHQVVEHFRTEYAAGGMFETALYPGIRDMLKRVRTSGIRTAVASSKPEIHIHPVLRGLGVEDLFDGIFGAREEEEYDTAAGRESKSRVVHRALSVMLPESEMAAQDAPFHAAMVGDRHYDMKGALQNGVTPVGVSYGYGTRAELEQAGAAFVADTTGELAEFLVRGRQLL